MYREFLREKDVFAVLPTGFGKSLFYKSTMLKKRFSGTNLRVSPLVALMEDEMLQSWGSQPCRSVVTTLQTYNKEAASWYWEVTQSECFFVAPPTEIVCSSRKSRLIREVRQKF